MNVKERKMALLMKHRVCDVSVFCCGCNVVARSRSKSMIQPSSPATAEFERREPGKRVRSQSESVTDRQLVSEFTCLFYSCCSLCCVSVLMYPSVVLF